MKRGRLRVVPLLVLAACATAGEREGAQPPPSDAHRADMRPLAPWSGAMLSPTDVPAVYTTEWRAAPNRATCALIAPVVIDRTDATSRRADFSGGWAVAYDLPGLRSAFGVAGTGSSGTGDIYDDWPHHIEWSDGSRAGYGPEGGSGENQLAYLRIAGQDCLYNVWSRRGVTHLESLLAHLRFVDVSR